MSDLDQPRRGYLTPPPPPYASPVPPAPVPVPPQPARPRQPRAPWIIAGISVLVAIGGVLFGLGVFKPSPANHSQASHGTFDISGTITVQGSALDDYTATADGGCEGTGGYSDMTSGTAVTVADATGKIVATGALGQGLDIGGGCQISFDVPGVPTHLSKYVVTVSHRGSQVLTPAQAFQPLDLTLGG